LDIGSDTLTGVNDQDYQPPFSFTGKIDKITLTIDRPQLTPEDEKRLMEAERVQPTPSSPSARAADRWEQCRCLLLAQSGRSPSRL